MIVSQATDPSSSGDKVDIVLVSESSSVAPLETAPVTTASLSNTADTRPESSYAAPLDGSTGASIEDKIITSSSLTAVDGSLVVKEDKKVSEIATPPSSADKPSSKELVVSASALVPNGQEFATLNLSPPAITQQASVSNTSSQAKETQCKTGELDSSLDNTGVPADDWCARAKGVGKRLSRKGEAFTLPSGEACIKIPNSVIEKNRKAWEPFVLGQFYSDPPSQGTLHNIVNGIWSKYYRDIAVSKLEGFAFLFRIPNAATRHRVVTQGLWQIEGQTMFVDKWEPGVIPTKPELTSAPIWLELRNVPFQFFNEDGLERIAGLVGHPKFLHPATANKTNLEVAKVFTVIDPRKPLPEAVNVQFDSGDISRVLVSSPWMPPVCGFCKEVGHITKRCPTAPKACSFCNSLAHASSKCPQKPKQDAPKKKTRRGRSKDQQQWRPIDSTAQPQKNSNDRPSDIIVEAVVPAAVEQTHTEQAHKSKLGTHSDKERGETSGAGLQLQAFRQRTGSGTSRSSHSDVQADSSDVESSDSELEEGEFSQHEPDFELVRNRKKFSGLKGNRGRGPKIN